jgi:hypothetical protein
MTRNYVMKKRVKRGEICQTFVKKNLIWEKFVNGGERGLGEVFMSCLI